MTPGVSVPVLSLHRMSMLPKFWMAGRCLTMTCSRAMRSAPCVSVTEVIIGRNSGVSPTPSATANSSDSNASCLRAMLTSRMNSTSDDGRAQDQQAEPPQAALELAFPARASASRAAMSPNMRLRAGGHGDRRAVPLTTDVPRKTQIRRVGPGRRRWRASAAPLVDRQRFAGQHRLLDGQIARLEQPRVGGHQVAGRQPERRRPARRRAAAFPARRRRAAPSPSATPTRAGDRRPAATDTTARS